MGAVRPATRRLRSVATRQSAPADGVVSDAPGVLALIRSDIDRYTYLMELDQTVRLGRFGRATVTLRAVVLCQGLQASMVHRVGHALVAWQPTTLPARLIRIGLRVPHFVASRLVEITTGISIADRASIGRGLYIGHFGGVIVGVVTMGTNCTLSHGVTLGRSGHHRSYGRPTLGDRVWVGPGAVIAGEVAIGQDAVVGANAVVTRAVPARSAAYGVPARITADAGSFDMVVYRGAETDASRLASIQMVANPDPGPRIPQQSTRPRSTGSVALT